MKRLKAVIIPLIFIMLIVPLSAEGFGAPSCILMEASTGKVLYEYNADVALPPASVTKIMTLLLVMEAVDDGRLDWNEMVQTSERAASMGGSQVYLEPGEEMPVWEMVKCVVVSSANDAAVALAEKVAGSEEEFVSQMNKRAEELGMKNTVFKNTNGLDDDVEGHVTSARDIAIMSRELINNHPKILEFSSIWMDTVRNGTFGLTNTNRLVRFYKGANGLKTGSTSKAKFCISATAERDGMQLIAVVMASPTRDERNESAKALLDHGFAGWELARKTPEAMEPLAVLGGVNRTVEVKFTEASAVLKKGSSSKLTQQTVLPDRISAPVTEGEVLGRVDYLLDGEVVMSSDILAAENVKKISYSGVLELFLKNLLLIER